MSQLTIKYLLVPALAVLALSAIPGNHSSRSEVMPKTPDRRSRYAWGQLWRVAGLDTHIAGLVAQTSRRIRKYKAIVNLVLVVGSVTERELMV
jgi:hypothetical protein